MESASRLTYRVVLVASLLLAVAPAAWPQSAGEARTAQYVLVIDDSGSMGTTDPDRLAVFAARSLLSMLDDRDEVTVVRLNGARGGQPAAPIEPLSRNRAALERLLDLGGGLASYAGKVTPCRSALAEVARRLEEAYRPNAAQTVLFLTDGQCEPSGEERPDPRSFLAGLRSHEEGLLHFFLLRFRGQGFSGELQALAKATRGEAIEVSGGDPAGILHPFALALSRSQGFEASLLAPGRTEIPAHQGAKRIRLLAVAPGQGPPLGVTLYDRQGNPLAPLRPPRTGEHRFESRKVFRFAALDYRPARSPVRVRVTGADGWRIVALPEYRLSVEIKALRGSCENPGPPLLHTVDTGTSVCFAVELHNDEGRIVDGAHGVTARVRVRRADQPGSPVFELTANPQGDQARFLVPRSNMERGNWEFQPVVCLGGGDGSDLVLTGRAMSLEASSVTIQAEPARLSFGGLRPGEERTGRLTLRGNFQPTRGRLELADRREVPACVAFDLSGKREGEAQTLSPDQGYSVVARVAPYCGPESFTRNFDTRLRVVFDASAGPYLPAVEIPIELALASEIQVSGAAVLRIRGGDRATVPIRVRGNNQRRDLALRAEVVPPSAGRLAFRLGVEAPRLRPGAGLDVPLEVRAHPCCDAGTYEARLRLFPADGSAYAPGAPRPEPLVVPVRVEVSAGSFLACWGTRLLWGLLVLLLLILALYVFNMIRQSRFLDPKLLAGRLVPLRWGSFGGVVPQQDAGEALRLVRRSLPLSRRALAWLKANPLAFGLPGRSYQESAELLLRPHRDVNRSQILLLAERGLPERVRREPERYVGRLFATAEGGLSFLAVPTAEGRVGSLQTAGGGAAWAGDGFKPRAVRCARNTRLLQPIDDAEDQAEGNAAGWQVG